MCSPALQCSTHGAEHTLRYELHLFSRTTARFLTIIKRTTQGRCSSRHSKLSLIVYTPNVTRPVTQHELMGGDEREDMHLPLMSAAVLGAEHAERAIQPPVCLHWQAGTCRFGVHCRFSHDVTAKRPLCRYWAQGYCARGSVCMYAHGDEPAPAAAATAAGRGRSSRGRSRGRGAGRSGESGRGRSTAAPASTVPDMSAGGQRQRHSSKAARRQGNRSRLLVFRDATDVEIEHESDASVALEIYYGAGMAGVPRLQ